MKRSTMKMMTAAILMNLLALTACAEKDKTGMDKMAETPMKDGMDSAKKDDMKTME